MKNNTEYRTYDNIDNAIKNTYLLGRKNQTLEYVKKMQHKYLTFDKKLKINTVFKYLESFVDISDPDITLPNYFHGIQTAEALRKDNHPEWLQLVGLIHDIGKVIYKWGCDEDGTSIKEQWGIVGDTFVVGCSLPEKIVFPEFNKENPDMKKSLYKTKLGIYTENCGLDNTICSWGHDEYLYQILKHNKCSLPDEALYIIRFHSLYPYHTNGEYKHLTNGRDTQMLKWLQLFNKYDLYTKSENIVINDNIKEYYNNLVNKYLNNGELLF